MKKFYCALILCFQYFAVFSQCENIVNNAGFEIQKSGSEIELPTDPGQVKHLLVWEDDITVDECFGDEVLIHSPDWCLEGTTFDTSGS